MFSPVTGADMCPFGLWEISPQLALLGPIPAPIPCCVCTNVLQAVGDSESRALLHPSGPAVSPTQEWSNLPPPRKGGSSPSSWQLEASVKSDILSISAKSNGSASSWIDHFEQVALEALVSVSVNQGDTYLLWLL